MECVIGATISLRITHYELCIAFCRYLAKLRALDAETTVDSRIKSTVIKLLSYLRTAGDAIIEVFAGDGKAFVHLLQLETAGVNVATIPKSKRCVAKNYPSTFANVDDLSEILTTSTTNFCRAGQQAGKAKLTKCLTSF